MSKATLWVREFKADQKFWFLEGWGDMALLEGTEWSALVSCATPEQVDHAYRKWTRPLVASLGLSPKDCLRKIRRQHGSCGLRASCQIAGPECESLAKAPWCFEPDGVEDPSLRIVAAKLIDAWREDTWVVLVT